MKIAITLVASLFTAGLATGVAAGWVKGYSGPTPYPKYPPVPQAVAPTPPVAISPPGYMAYPPNYSPTYSQAYSQGYPKSFPQSFPRGYRAPAAAPRSAPKYPAYPAYPAYARPMAPMMQAPGTTASQAVQPATSAPNQAAGSSSENQVAIQNFQFGPATVQIKPGQTVTWKQADNAPHTVSGEGFDSGTLSKGQQFSRRFDEAGTFDYYCKLHPNMQATVIVTES